MTFDDFGLEYDLLEGLVAMGYAHATPIQEQAIPLILQDNDLIACAQTGTGKTAAFLLPILNKILISNPQKTDTLILTPTRELAMQIDTQVEAMAYYIPVSSIAVYGGNDGITWEHQKKALKKGTDIIIATPGRLISLIAMNSIDFSELKHLVLDEADRMLDMGFADDLERIIRVLPKHRQTLMFSATMPTKIRALAKSILHNPKEISIEVSKPAEGITQLAYCTFDSQKDLLLEHIFKTQKFESIIIFCSTKQKVKVVNHVLKSLKLNSSAFHSDLTQTERENIILQFKNKNINILVGTDVLSRGIDVSGIDLVINYDVPPDPEDYVHRIGRTARAESEGTAITFINENDMGRFGMIEKLIQNNISKLSLPDFIGEGPVYNTSFKLHKNKSFRGKKHFKKSK